MDNYSLVAQKIISGQKTIIGPVALDLARELSGLEIDQIGNVVKVMGDGKEVLTKLVDQYKKMFGQASVEACKDAVKEIRATVPVGQLPSVLQ